MKFRQDYVTNSSSTGYVAIHVKSRNEIIPIEEFYSTGWGGWIWNHRNTENLGDELDEVNNGEELFDLLCQYVENFACHDKSANEKIKNIMTRDDLTYISLYEKTNFGDSNPHIFNFEYDFEEKKITEYEDKIYRKSDDMDVHEVDNRIEQFLRNMLHDNEEYFFEIYEYFMDSHNENVWTAEEIEKQWDKEERECLIKEFNSRGVHYDPNDKYISPAKGSSNNRKELVDFPELLEVILKDDYMKEAFLDEHDYEMWD